MLKYEKIKEILLISFVLSMFIGVGISFHKVYLFHVLFIPCLGLFLWDVYKTRNDYFAQLFHKNKTLLFMILYPSWYVISLLWSDNLTAGVKNCIFVFLGCSSTLILQFYFREKDKLKKMLRALAILFILHLIICFLEIFTPFRMPISPASSLAHFFGRVMDSQTLLGNTKYALSQPTSFFWGPNDTSLVTLLGLPFFLNSPKMILKVVGVAASGIIILFASSRGILVIYAAYLLIYFLTNLKKLKKEIIILPIGIVFSLFVFWAYGDRGKFNEFRNSLEVSRDYLVRMPSLLLSNAQDPSKLNNLEIDGAVGERLVFSLCSFMYGSGHRFFGIGAGSLSGKKCTIDNHTYALGSIHNYWLEIGTEIGFLFLFVYLAWYLRMATQLFRASLKLNNVYFQYLLKSYATSLILFLPSVLILSRGIYFLPKYLMYGASLALLSLAGSVKDISEVTPHETYR